MKKIAYIIITFIASIVVTVQPVLALDAQFYSGNDILFYDDTFCGQASTTSADSSSVNLTGDGPEKVLRFFTSKGLTLAQAAGFVGNMTAESGIRPDIYEGGATVPPGGMPRDGQGFGLVQWTFSVRQQPLVELAKKTNRQTTDMSLQLDYVWIELNGSYKATLQALQSRKDWTPTQATIIIHGNTRKTSVDPQFSIAPKLGYEASNDSAENVINHRASVAEAAYKKYKGTIPDGNGAAAAGVTTNTSHDIGGVKAITVGNIPIEGVELGATLYGGEYNGGKWVPNNGQQGGGKDDNGMGNDGVPLPGKVAYAELDMGTAMGKLPNGTKLQITYKGRSVVAEKRDVGTGGAPIEGKKRAIDLWWETARMLDMRDSAVVTVKAVDPSTPLTPFGTDPVAPGGDEASQLAASGGCNNGSNGGPATPSGSCPVTKAKYGAGVGRQLTSDELISIYGDPGKVKASLVDVDFLGKKVQAHKAVAGCLQAVVNEIKAKNISYTAKDVGMYRIDGTGYGQIGIKSYHNYGIAIDINPSQNPYCNSCTTHDIPQEMADIFKNHGFSWGGDWRSVKDWMHFEYNGYGPEDKGKF